MTDALRSLSGGGSRHARLYRATALGVVSLAVLVDGAGPAVVLLPSSQRDSLDLSPLAACLAAKGWTVLRPQPRGMAGSIGPLSELTLTDLAADLAFVIAQLAPGGCAIVAGHAYGHFVARVADLRHPERVRGVVALAAAARNWPAELPALLDCASDPTQARQSRLAALQQAFFAPGHDASPWLSGWHPQLRKAYRQAGQIPDRGQWWPVSHAPVLDLQAANDPWRPAASRDELRLALGDALVTVAVIDQASHALPVEQPQAVALAMASWAAKLPA